MKYNCKKQITLVITCFLLVISAGLKAQHYETQITKITDEKGESPSATFAIIQDSLGFIWFGTIDGLYRYDGYNFKIYRNNPDNPNSLSNNTIRSMSLDPEGKLWIATQGGGLTCFDTKNEKFTHYKYTGQAENEIRGNDIWSVMADRKGNIWAGISGIGVDKIESKSGKITHFNPLPEGNYLKQGQTIRCLIEDTNGTIWVGLPDAGFSSINPATGRVRNYSYGFNEGGLTNTSVYNLFFDSAGKLWVVTFGGGINIFDPKTEKFSYLTANDRQGESLISNLTYSVKERTKDEFWIATEYGISSYNQQTRHFKNYRQSSCSDLTLSENRVRCIFVDNKNIIWAGTESGVDKIILHSKFQVYRFSRTENTLNEGLVRTIYEDRQQNLWFGLIDNGLIRYEPKSGKYNHYLHDKNNSKSIPGNNINEIFEDSEGTIWIGEWNNGLIRYNRKTDNFTTVANGYTQPNTLTDNRIQAITQNKPGILWIGTEGGITCYNIPKHAFRQYAHEAGNSQSICGNSMQSNAFVFDKDGNLWVGTWSFGMTMLEIDDSTNEVTRYSHWKHDPENPESLVNDNIISFHFDKKGNLWIGSFGGGLSKMNLQANTFKNYTTKDGLPNNVIFSILEDSNNKLWLSTDNGISMFDPETENFQNYYKSDGLQDNHFFWGASHKTQSGKMFFGGINGINSFIPEEVKPDSSPARPVLVSLELFSEIINTKKSLSEITEIEFKHNQNFIAFSYASLDYKKPDKNQYKYMLKGFDKEWINAGNRRTAAYTNLQPGNYEFMLLVSNSDGIWNKTPLRLKVTINPPWWRTFWFLSLFTITIVFLLYLIVTFRLRFLRSQNIRLEKQVKMRTEKIENQNQLLEQQTKEIQSQYQELNMQKEELADKNDRLLQTLAKLEETQKALIESEKIASLGILTAGVAHEINNPLNFIAVSIDTIKTELTEIETRNVSPDAELLKDLHVMLSHAETGIDRITKITNSLKAYVKKGPNDDDLLDIDEVIISSVKLISPKIPAYLAIQYKLEDVPKVSGQKHKLSQVIINILENALDAIAEKPNPDNENIAIETGNEEIDGINYVSIRISNTGPPISEKVFKNIFDPFFTTKAPNKGTGLGLYLSYNIIKEHKGLFKVENLNNKANFAVLLPAVIIP